MNHVIGEKLAVQMQDRLRVALILVEQLLKLPQQFRQIGAETSAPIADATVRLRKQSHEDVRAPQTVPARLRADEAPP